LPPRRFDVVPGTIGNGAMREATQGVTGDGRESQAARAGRLRVLLRLAQILLIVARHVLGAAADAAMAFVTRRRRLPGGHIGPRRLRRAFDDLGVGFVKVGQLLAARADLLPDSYRAELARLRDDVRPVPTRAVITEIEGASGLALAATFTSFSLEPVAAASISQVHAATLSDGREVAVKVRRPGIVTVARADLALLAMAAAIVARLSRNARILDPKGVVAEVGTMLRQEMDFIAEAENARAIREVFSADPTVVVPEIVTSLSGPSVVVMDYVEGISLGDTAALDAAGYSRTHFAASVIRANVAMILGPSRFHADLHPGNLLALPEGRLGLLDFGAAGRADDETTNTAVKAVMDAVASGDPEGLAGGVLLMTVPSGPVDRSLLSKELDQVVLAPLGDSSLGALQAGQLLRDLVGVMRRHGLRARPEVTALLRAVMTCESTARELDPELSFRRVVVPFLVTRAFGWPAYAAEMPEPRQV
jgi:ubiquinone biosynthesis protein